MKKILIPIVSLLVLTCFVGKIEASENNTVPKNINVIALGNALTQDQKQQTLASLGQTKEVPLYTTDGNDLMKYISKTDFNANWQVYSSVHLETKEQGSGIDVEIATPSNITSITADQYKNAAQTAGITDAKITVASVIPIDGSGALAGVYKIVEESGGQVDATRTQAAQEEMKVLNEITSENQNVEGYSDEKLNAAQEEAKEMLAKAASEGQKINKEVVTEAVNTALKNQGLDQILTKDQVNQIIELLTMLNNKNIFDQLSKEINLDDIKNQLEAKSQGLWGKIQQFFSNIWQSIQSLFGKDSTQATNESN
ncbi:MAG TPA: DUF1002 domain-containing protein [Enterococcus columbae]|nr:DUF1002 domain-containing protein [Enterococcus columbae]